YQQLELFSYPLRAYVVAWSIAGESVMNRMIGRLGVAAAIAVVLFVQIDARAQENVFPTGPVRIVTQQGPGGATIGIMRLVSDRLEKRWGRPVTFITQ